MTDPPLVPILVGVTGRRDPFPKALPQVEAAVCDGLTALDQRTRRSGVPVGSGPLHVVTALAEGADQLVAEAAESRGLPLVAISPMPLYDYLGTFENRWQKIVCKSIGTKLHCGSSCPGSANVTRTNGNTNSLALCCLDSHTCRSHCGTASMNSRRRVTGAGRRRRAEAPHISSACGKGGSARTASYFTTGHRCWS
jgi:hypothetical protein